MTSDKEIIEEFRLLLSHKKKFVENRQKDLVDKEGAVKKIQQTRGVFRHLGND